MATLRDPTGPQDLMALVLQGLMVILVLPGQLDQAVPQGPPHQLVLPSQQDRAQQPPPL